MEYDVVYIGGGPGGYVGAIKAAQLGLKVALVEQARVGGTCLIKGCIPTKTLIAHSDVVKSIREAAAFGVKVEQFSIDYNFMKQRKDAVVNQLSQGVTHLVKSHGVTLIEGIASFLSPREIKVLGPKNLTLQAKHFVIATGSVPMALPSCPIDYHTIHDSTSILEITKLPKTLIVLGGGYIGCEFASLFQELGVKVTIVEFLPGIVLSQGEHVSRYLTKAFEKKGIELRTSLKVESSEKTESGVKVHLSNGSWIEADMLLVSVGRRPYTEGLNLELAGLGTTPAGFISINDKMETDVKGIYAIGDVTGKAMLAHVASHQGIVAAENIKGVATRINYDAIPAVIFTHPEIATVGMTKEMALKKGLLAESATFPFSALGKAVASKEEGYVEIVFNPKTESILGAFIVGHGASNLISEMTLAIQNELTLTSLTHTIHPHPTLSEAWAEAAHLALHHPLHLPPR